MCPFNSCHGVSNHLPAEFHEITELLLRGLRAGAPQQ